MVRPSKVGKTRFCSKECRAKWQKERMKGSNHPNWKGGKKKVICKECGKEFYVSQYSNQMYCSKECAYRAKRDKRIPLVCPQCGKTFYVMKSQANIRKYCSKKCQDKANMRRVIKICENCGKPFEVMFHEYNKRRFCSYKCMGEWMSKHRVGENHPLWNRVTLYCEYCGKPFTARAYEKDTRRFCSKKCGDMWRKKFFAGENNPNWKGGRPNIGVLTGKSNVKKH